MNKPTIKMKINDWSLNLEDPYYEDNPNEILEESMAAIQQTSKGCYVNIVTPGKFGDPRHDFISQLEKRINAEDVLVREVRYIDECGCGGYVTRIFR